MSLLSRLRRIIGLALLLVLAGCGLLRLTYDQAPKLTYWWLDAYVDIRPEQAPKVHEAIERWFDWHRRTQLPEYAALLAQAEPEVMVDTTPAAMCAWSAEIERRLDLALEQAEPALAELALMLAPAQRRHIAQRMAKVDAELRADFLQADPAERRAASFKRLLGRYEMLYGRLDAVQRERLAALLASSPFDAQRWLDERRTRQREIMQALDRLGAAVAIEGRGVSAAQSQAQAQAQVAVHSIVKQFLHSPRAEDLAYERRLVQDHCVIAATIHNLTTPAQRRAARARLQAWEEDARTLAANGSPAASR